MIELSAEQAGAHNLPPIGFTVDLTGSDALGEEGKATVDRILGGHEGTDGN